MDTAPHEGTGGWTIEEAERLLESLRGVVAARLVSRPGGEVEEIHVLTTDEVAAKQTVRNVESALLAHLDLSVDHRKISVAQTKERQPSGNAHEALPVMLHSEPGARESRLLFQGHQVETERSRRVRHQVEIEWRGERYMGQSSAADLPRARLEAVGQAALSAVETAVIAQRSEHPGPPVTLSLDGVKVVEAFDRRFVLVSVHAISGREVTALAGATVVDDSTDRSVILATLQATDRWVRGSV